MIKITATSISHSYPISAIDFHSDIMRFASYKNGECVSI
jgi:hypothetical protein